MKKPKFFIFAALVLFSLNAAYAQTENKFQVEPSYEIILHVVVATDKTTERNNQPPPALTGIITRLKNDYSFRNYSLAATFFERITQSGEIYHNGILNQLNQSDKEKIYFSNWSLKGLKTGEDAKGKNQIHFQGFTFGAKVPVVVSTVGKGDGGEVINYENTGVSITRFSLPENAPTLIGSMATPNTDEFVFLILTVRPV